MEEEGKLFRRKVGTEDKVERASRLYQSSRPQYAEDQSTWFLWYGLGLWFEFIFCIESLINISTR